MMQQETKNHIFRNVIEIVFFLFLIFLIRTFIFGLYQVPSGSMETTMLVGERFLADKLTYFFRAPRRSEIISFNDPLMKYSDNTLKELFQRYVWGPDNITKRVIGIPGDEIMGTVENGKPVVYRNGEKLDEVYVNKYPLICVYNPRTHHENTYSFDPSKSLDKQPFYFNLGNKVIRRDATGNPYVLYPGLYIPSKKADVLDRLQENNRYWDESDYFHVKLGPDEYWLMGDNRLNSKDSRAIGPVNGKLIHGRIIWRYWSLDSDEPWMIVDLIKHPIEFWNRIRFNRFFQIIR